MATERLTDLLGIAPGTPRPNAYQLFGLKTGENDPQRIGTAINQTLRRLKASQENADPQVWKQAAAAVNRARKILTDADAKAAYDAKLRARPGKASSRSSAATSGSAAVVDPLQGWLPSSDPLAAFDIAAAAERVATLAPPQPTVLATADAEPESATEAEPTGSTLAFPDPSAPPQPAVHDPLSPETDVAPLAVPALSVPDSSRSVGSGAVSRRRRRRGFPWAATIMTVAVLAMLAGIGFGIHLLTDRERQVASDDPEAATTAAPPPAPPSETVDPVMGSLTTGTERKSRGNPRGGNLLSEAEIARLRAQPDPATPQPPDPNGEMPPNGERQDDDSRDMAAPAETADAADVASEDQPAMDTSTSNDGSPQTPDESAIRAGQAAIGAAEQAIQNNQWTEMKTLAEQAVRSAANAEQKARARRLFQVADLANYYYVGLVRSLQRLNAGDQIELENIGTVGVVEASESTFAVQVNGRPKSFDFDKIPFFVVDAIAKLSMDLSDPTTQAAKAVHQAISTNATPEHRQQAIDWLAALPDNLQGADPEDLQQAIRELYPNL